MTAASARIIAAASAEASSPAQPHSAVLSSVCATTVDNSGVKRWESRKELAVRARQCNAKNKILR